MCPLRFVIVFFSTVLAGYFAWRAVDSSPELISEDSPVEDKEKDDKQGLGFKGKMWNGFWKFVDMASGRYLWRNLKEL
ncbi:Methyltransferase-like protein [Hirschfeldia incana]|nr:Methyltransferase-like protein [Hirschfeldia incana]